MIMKDSKRGKKGRSISKGQECTDRKPEENAPHPEGIRGASGQLPLMLCWETSEEKGMDIGTMVISTFHQASSFFCWGWWGKLIRKSHDSVGPQMGKVLEKNQRSLEDARRGATAWHSCCVYMAGSLDGTQWSGHPVRLAVSTGCFQEEPLTCIPCGPWNQLGVQGDLLGSLTSSSVRGPIECV